MKEYLAKITFENQDGSEYITMYAYEKENGEIGIHSQPNERLLKRDKESFEPVGKDIFINFANTFLDHLKNA